MQTSRLQIGLITCLSLGLGLALSSQQAIGYPSGAAVSSGINPVRSATGHWDLSSSSTSASAVITAPEDQDLILTEIMVGLTQDSDGCMATGHFTVRETGGDALANIPVNIGHLTYSPTVPVQLQFDSGLRMSAGSSVDVEWEFVWHNCGYGSYDLDYILSGYLAAP